jgi:DNA adenine methylase
MRSPVVWLGGKMRLAKRIIDLMPEHERYIEVFGGGAAVLFAKPPSLQEVYNDVDSGLVNLFRVLRDGRKTRQLQRKLMRTPYSREEWAAFRETAYEVEGDVEAAHRWFSVARMSFAGRWGSSWGFTVSGAHKGMAKCVCTYREAGKLLTAATERMQGVIVEHDDWRKILTRFDGPEALFYLDPPYVPETRKGGEYRHELTTDDHVELVERLLALKGKALLSGYRSPVYAPLERAGWKRIDWQVLLLADKRAKREARTESLWTKP